MVATGKGAKELYDNRKEVYASAKDFAGKLTSKDDKVRDYAVGQAKAYEISFELNQEQFYPRVLNSLSKV
ncbi:polymorphic toxin type 10 domain-containing protein [Leptospira sp. mild_001]|uniref:polymorphic toxin type 10 domain-containing protein n=1 Tax=Leptospira sp. mild_001 TaxID=2838238 RepID=UPI001E470103|nr:polymorphic toxin type 10 domain-containing protein [Leptospira sp. mild_001]